MGFLGLVPADTLTAVYDVWAQTLTLTAKGNARNYTSGIKFVRDTGFVGGLKYSLYGWTGPLGFGTTPYEHQQGFKIQLPSRVVPSNTVIIDTQNHATGEVVKIEYILFDGLGPVEPPSSSEPVNNTSNAQQELSLDNESITALFKEPFQIKESTKLPAQATIQMDFDPSFLTLTSSGFAADNIVWTFNSLQTGNTQVVLTIRGGIATFVMKKIIDIRIIVLEESLKSSGIGFEPGEILSFAGRVSISQRIVQTKYPNAQLLEVDATLPHGATTPVNDPNQLSQLRVVFNVDEGGQQGTAIINSTGWGEFAPVQYIPEPWLEDLPFDDRSLTLSIVDAAKALRDSGFASALQSCTLRHPLGPGGKGFDQPYYIFGLVEDPQVIHVGVGAMDGAIYVNRTGQKVLPLAAQEKCT